MYTTSELERQIATARASVERNRRLQRLLVNPDFKALIQEDYLTTYAKNALNVAASLPNNPQREVALNDALGASSLFNWLQSVEAIGAREEARIPGYEEMLAEIRNEEVIQNG